MRNQVIVNAAILAFGVSAAGPAFAAPAHKPVAAKTVAPKRVANGPVVLGTTQLPGDFGKVGTTYTIGKSEPINFTLRSAEYSIKPITVGMNTWVPEAGQKLLVLHYTVHNPIPREQNYCWSSIRFTAVDGQDTNHEFIQAVSREGSDQSLSLNLKPAQKLDVVTALLVPANGVTPKLIVTREQGAPVIRYDLHGKARALIPPYAAESDTDGATALGEVASAPGAFYPIGIFDARLDEASYVEGPLLKRDPGPGNRFITAVFTIKNTTATPQTYTWSDFIAELRDADGEKVKYTQALLKATRDEVASDTVAPGEEARIRFFFPLPKNVAAKSLRLSEGKKVGIQAARVFVFDISSAK